MHAGSRDAEKAAGQPTRGRVDRQDAAGASLEALPLEAVELLPDAAPPPAYPE